MAGVFLSTTQTQRKILEGRNPLFVERRGGEGESPQHAKIPVSALNYKKLGAQFPLPSETLHDTTMKKYKTSVKSERPRLCQT